MIIEQSLITAPLTGKCVQFISENILITASGNRLYAYNLHNNTVSSISQARFNIKQFSISGQSTATVDDQHNICVDGIHISGKKRIIKAIKHSPDGKMIAIARQDKLIIYNLKMEKIKSHSNKHKINGICWSPDSRFILSWGDDNTVIMNAVFPLRLYVDSMLQAHKFKIANAFFYNQRCVITIDILGKICVWKWVDDYLTEEYKKYQQIQRSKGGHKILLDSELTPYSEEEQEYMSQFEMNVHKGRFILDKKLNLKESKITLNFNAIKSVIYHPSNLLIIGMKNGLINVLRFDLEQQIFLNLLQSFQISSNAIDSISINSNGNWIALGIRSLSQLIVWEWRSQTYIINQQALAYESTCATLSPDLQTLAIGTLGGVVRLYDFVSNFCIAKFDDQHTTKVTAIKYCPTKQGVLVSASLDGTIRAYDTIRLKCFRVMQPEIPNQLNCLDVDPSGELICAGAFDPYEIYVFSLQTGQLVEVIAAHQSPITSLKFTQVDDAILLISGSWDKTIRLHDLYARGKKEGSGGDLMLHNSEVTCIAVKEKQAAIGTMSGEVVIWDVKDVQILFTFDVNRDIQGGRSSKDSFGATKNQNLKYLNSLEYSKDGQYLIGGGNSKYLCVYDTKFRILIRKIVISNNMSLDGMKLKINFSRIDQENQNIEESENENNDNLPGAKNYDVSKRSTKRIPVQVHQIEYSESNRQMIVCHSEGVSIFGNSTKRQYFDPLDMDESVNVEEILLQISNKQYSQSLLLALKLNQFDILLQVFNHIPIEHVVQIVPAIPDNLLIRLLETIIRYMQEYRKVEIALLWINQILIEFSHLIKGPQQNQRIQQTLQEILKQIKIDFNRIKEPIRKCINQLEYLGGN